MARGVVKFFNDAKGFGFIAPDDGANDIFVHVSAVERSGLGGLNEGDEVTFEVEQDRRSGKLAAIDLQVTGFSPPSPRSGSGSPRRGFDHGDQKPPSRGANAGGQPREPAGSGSGVVKWFNPSKGFGFIQPGDGGTDVFVHISAVERAGLRSLEDGQSVSYDLERDPRSGKTSATNLRLEQ
jgi:CspA family cold shock protein